VSRRRPSLKQRVDRLLHHRFFEAVLVVLILSAVAALLAEAAFPRGSGPQRVLNIWSYVTAALFSIELSLRFWVAPRKSRFFARYWIDILAVVPLAQPLRLLRILMLLRLFRVGVLLHRRLAAYQGLLRGTLNELTIVATLSITIVLGGALIIHAGHGTVDYPGDVLDGTLEGALWYAVYTVIAGEPTFGVPDTELGRTVTLGLMLGGLTVFGMFVGAVSATMSTVLSNRLEVGDMDLDELSDHIVVCGWNPAGVTMVQELFSRRRARRPIVIVTEGSERPAGLDALEVPKELIYHFTGDYTQPSVLKEVGIGRAGSAILLTDTTVPRADQDRDARTVLTALTIERLQKGIFCCAELINGEHATVLKMANVEEVVVRDWYAGVILGSMERNQGLSAVLNDILSTTEGNAFHRVLVPKRLSGQTIGAMHTLLKQQHGAILVSWERELGAGRRDGDPPARDTRVNPPVDLVVQAEDTLVVIADGAVRL
jgi:voltage-gated potassium channel